MNTKDRSGANHAKETPEQRAAAGRCVVCNTQAGDLRRGLCNTDYGRWRSARRQLPKDRREKYDALLIEKGRLLASRQGQRNGGETDVFEEALKEFLEE